MPRKSVPDEPEKSHRLTLAELAAYDDICTDVMIDNVSYRSLPRHSSPLITDEWQAYFFKTRIRKNRNKHIPVRGVKEDDVPTILLHKVIVEKDPVAAEKAFLELPAL